MFRSAGGETGRIPATLGTAKGFTLLEVMISLAILSGVIVTVIASLNYHLSVLSYDIDLVTATIIGREKVELHAVTGLPKIRSGAAGERGTAHERFRWKVETHGTEVPGLVRVETEVKWDETPGVTFVTFSR
jgi:general secretion pathway protein I